MKNSEIRALSIEELNQKLVSEIEALHKLQFAHAISPIENPMRLKETRKLIARINTAIRQKQVEK
jgi:large subunit ribosomal protein L29